MRLPEDPSSTAAMTPEEKELLALAIDHDARQPQHSLEMALRTLRIIASDLEAKRFEKDDFDETVRRLKTELTYVAAAVRQVVDIQQDLIDAIRLEFKNTQPFLRTVRAGDVLERVKRSNRAIAGNVQIRAPLSRLSFVSDERWLERILNNLVVNALYHAEATKILVLARSRGGSMIFEIRDNGRGMSPEKIASAFRPVVLKGSRDSLAQAPRSGLGLYNVRMFAARLGGTVECESVPGRGTCFRLRFPGPVDREERYPRLSTQSEVVAVARNKFVAILDDDRAVLRTTKRVFEDHGIAVYADHDPLRWLSVITDLKRPPDLTLLDFQLKGQDCSLQLDIVRQKWGDRRPDVILMTGHTTGPRLDELAKEVPVLRKPLTEDKFWLVIEVLSGRRAFPRPGFM